MNPFRLIAVIFALVAVYYSVKTCAETDSSAGVILLVWSVILLAGLTACSP